MNMNRSNGNVRQINLKRVDPVVQSFIVMFSVLCFTFNITVHISGDATPVIKIGR